MISKHLKKYKKLVEKNKKTFEKLEKQIFVINDDEAKCKFAVDFGVYAYSNGSGYFSSNIIEEELLKIAQEYSVNNLEKKYKPNTILHVMSEAYITGGHTRVVERWIEYANNSEEHSLVFTGLIKQSLVTKRLKDAINNKKGDIYHIDYQKSFIDKGLELRKLASKFERIILHVHMNDIIPILAFGNKQFERPVIFYNHADHLFWYGVSIADIVGEIRIKNTNISNKKRGVIKSVLLGIPPNKTHIINLNNKKEARAKLGFSPEHNIILTYGSAYKYTTFDKCDFLNTVIPILKMNKNNICIGIGIDEEKSPSWIKYTKIYKGQLIRKDNVPHKELITYINAADLILDSYPMPGATALYDAIINSRAVLTRYNWLDYVCECDVYCKNIKTTIQKIKQLLYNEEENKKHIALTRKAFEKWCSYNRWQKNVNDLYSRCPEKHSIQEFKSENIICDIDILNTLLNGNAYKTEWISINKTDKRIIIIIFGIKISFKIKENKNAV